MIFGSHLKSGQWSAYGAGVSIMLNESEAVMQYYVPFLSASQLFVDPSRPSSGLRSANEASNVGSSRETSSEGSCKRDAEDASSSDVDIHDTTGTTVFEYFERDSPFIREPLANKISILTSKFPGLKTYRSCDLLPQSWLSVAWYLIYRIPTGPTLENVDACFLTYHSLSTPLSSKDIATPQVINSTDTELQSSFLKLSLPSIALASYRFEASVWESDCQKDQLLL